ncbi:PPC domain-containing DNA-binding protein [uncultured Azohydromonas sp.]|uniref:PPC domain-containing DNA-binding protein n=1 Tax=uncultured Azohydromonas sp. TaxID=487342 RepID=UPI00261263F8|nr:PPC domain-containing DNA-binding protein [uncultured Azohydromonas sp.]
MDASMYWPLRLQPGTDLRRALEAAVAQRGCEAAFVLGGIGSLGEAQLRLAGADVTLVLPGPLEVLTLSGSVGAKGSHLHASLSDAQGRVLGGHLGYGCGVRTTAEVLLALLPGWRFTREPDAATGYDELVARWQGAPPPAVQG